MKENLKGLATDGESAGVAVVGASGYTGADLIRLIHTHPKLHLTAATANAHAGSALGDVFPHLAMVGAPDLVTVDEADFSGADAIFCALPHGTSADVIATLPTSARIIDLSADFRLNDADLYAEWYGGEHRAPQLLKGAVYGLTELRRKAVAKARLVACPGCFPTATLLALEPLASAGLIVSEDLIIDAKTGVSGAGRSLKEQNLFCETAESVRPYGVGRHRHAPEIEQELSKAFGAAAIVNFTPHLAPMNRGELVTCYVKLAGEATAADLRAALANAYDGAPFVHVAGEGDTPATRDVRGSNHCKIGVFEDRLPGRAVVIAAIDNLVKGSSGQAIQNLNVMMGWPETLGLEAAPLYP
ncbi:MAG: N-acetyl-gamma-glutamyl-phosphate reductase [Pseudomonadota bacterium]